MHFPHYWAHGLVKTQSEAGKPLHFTCWRWSDDSFADAQRQAEAAAGQIAMRFVGGTALERYSYGQRPLREEVLQAIKGPDNNELALITRNAYGAHILNAAEALFADIDFPQKPAGTTLGSILPLASGLKRLLGGKPEPEPEALALEALKSWSARNPSLGLRVYRTAGGLRALLTNHTFDPRSAQAQALLNELGSDPLYVRLCRAQECFRARLTPKPWRLNLPMPPVRYPYENVSAEAKFQRWQTSYTQATSGYQVCRLVAQLGKNEVHPRLLPLIELHDRWSCKSPATPLA